MKFSVLTPSYNYAQFIGAAICSVQDQQPGREHIVFDANSTDGTKEVVDEHMWTQLTFRQEPDEGQSDALNKAFRESTGDLIGWLNADEFYLPGALDTVEKVFESCPDVDVVIGDTLFVDAAGQLLRLLPSYPVSRFVLRNRGCVLSTCSTFFRRRSLVESPLDPNLRVVMDWDLYLTLVEGGHRFRSLSRPLAAFRLHEDQVTHELKDRDTEEHKLVRTRHAIRPKPTSVQRSAGDHLHAAKKFLSGAYNRQRAVAQLRGLPLLVGERVDPRSWQVISTTYGFEN